MHADETGYSSALGEAELELHVDTNVFKRVVRHHAHTKYSGKGAEVEMERADIM